MDQWHPYIHSPLPRPSGVRQLFDDTHWDVQLSHSFLSILHLRRRTSLPVLARVNPIPSPHLLLGYSARRLSWPIRPPYGLLSFYHPPHSRPSRKASHASPLPFPLPQPDASRAGLPNKLEFGSVQTRPFILFHFARWVRLLDLYIPWYTP